MNITFSIDPWIALGGLLAGGVAAAFARGNMRVILGAAIGVIMVLLVDYVRGIL